MTLRARIAALPGDPPLVRSPSAEYRRDSLLAAADGLRRGRAGLRVGLQVADVGRALPMLVALDGDAEAIALFSPSLDDATVRRLADECRLHLLVVDAPARWKDAPSALAVESSLPAVPQEASKQPGLNTEWLVMTSGTTDVPKPVSHTLASLTRTARIDPARGATVRWGLLYDYTRFAGLQVMLQSLLSGSLLIAPAADAALGAKLADFARFSCTHLSGTPSLWRRILMTPGAERLALRQVTLGGEIADDRILQALADRFPAARVTHVFASTEAGAAFSVTDRRAGFPLAFLTDAPGGIELKIEEARLFVRNPMVRGAYAGSDRQFADADGWVDTGDSIEIVGDRALFRGRASGVINVGGDKVHPEEVERVLRAHPFVAEARVWGKPNPISGALVMAEIVLADPALDASAAAEAVSTHATAALGRTRAPAFIRAVPAIGTTAAGKLART